MPSIDINWWAVLVAVGVNMVVGAIWYSPALFAKQWAKLTGRKMNEMGDGASGYLITTIAALLQVLVLVHAVRFAQWFYPTQGKFVLGLMVGGLAWAGFVFVPQLVNSVFANTRKKLLAINTGYFLVVLLINGVILSVWR